MIKKRMIKAWFLNGEGDNIRVNKELIPVKL